MKTCVLAVVLMVAVGALGAGPATGPATTKPAQQKTPEYVYRGHKVNPRWVDEMFGQFAGQLAVEDGKVISVGKEVTAAQTPPANPPALETVVIVQGPVMDVLDKSSVVVKASGERRPVRLQGLDTSNLADGAMIGETAAYLGTFKYAFGTIQSYRVLRRPTKEEFVGALRDGLILVRYRRDDFGKFTEQKVP